MPLSIALKLAFRSKKDPENQARLALFFLQMPKISAKM